MSFYRSWFFIMWSFKMIWHIYVVSSLDWNPPLKLKFLTVKKKNKSIIAMALLIVPECPWLICHVTWTEFPIGIKKVSINLCKLKLFEWMYDHSQCFYHINTIFFSSTQFHEDFTSQRKQFDRQSSSWEKWHRSRREGIKSVQRCPGAGSCDTL